MKLFKIVPVVVTILSYCTGGLTKAINEDDVIEIDIDELKDFRNSTLNKRTIIPPLTSKTCDDNTKECNIGFSELRISIYDLIWNVYTPIATISETLRGEKEDEDEYISMVSTIRNYNAYFKVYIRGAYIDGGCFNDKNNKCTFDAVLNDTPKPKSNAHFNLRNLNDLTTKQLRFKYSDWLGKCYKTWKVTFDIQGTEDDLKKWYWYDKINFEDYR